MNRYVVRTSLVWIVVLVIVGAIWMARSHRFKPAPASKTSAPGGVQPAAVGPPLSANPPDSLDTTANAQPPMAPVRLSPERMQSIGVKTGTVEYKQLSDDIRATGTVDIDQKLVSYVQVRFAGYIHKVFVNATYLYVHKGQPLFTIYSPALVATENEYLLARQDAKLLSTSTVNGVASGAASLTSAAEQRLAQWQIPQRELDQLKRTGKPIPDLTIDSPVSGYITEYNALPNLYVQPSTRLYTVADLSRVWVNAQVFQDEVGRLRPGDPVDVTVDAYPGRTFYGRINQILPQVDLATRTVTVRLVIQNPGLKLKPGMYVNCDLKSPLGRQLVIPASAVFQTGARQLAFLYSGNGAITPQEILIGPQVGNEVVVLKGLRPHQRIVTSANFLIDSESQLQAAAGSFMPPPPGVGANASSPTGMTMGAIEFSTNPNPPQKGQNILRVRITDTKGTPIPGAQVTVRFYLAAMPAMGMAAANTTVTLTSEGGGIYEGTASLEPSGTWQVTILARKNGQTIASKQLSTTVTGGA